jgi:hypothetical protein
MKGRIIRLKILEVKEIFLHKIDNNGLLVTNQISNLRKKNFRESFSFKRFTVNEKFNLWNQNRSF